MKKVIRNRLQKFHLREEKTAGFLGRADGTVRVPGRNHWVYVRLWNGEVVEAFNNGSVPVAFGLAVQVAYRSGRYYVAPRDAYDQPVFVGLPDGAEDELQWPGSHTLYVRPEQILPGLIIPKTGMTVIVYGGSLPLSTGGYITIPTQEIDLTPYKPAANAHWATVGWMNNGTISVVTGGAANSLGELQESGIPSTGGYDLAAIKLFNGQSSISHGKFGSVIVDLRFFKPGTSTAITWGSIAGTLSNQTDLNDALNAKASATDLNNHINNATDAHDASAISIVDAGNYYAGTNVESALAEIGAKKGYDIIGGHGNGGSVPASTTYYIAPYIPGLISIERSTPLPLSGTLKRLYVRTATSQPVSGSLVFTIYNYTTMSSTGISVTIPANSPSGTFSNVVNTYSYNAGDLLQIRITNNATSASAVIGGVTFLLEYAL